METIFALILGLAIGAAIGVLAMLIAKGKSSDGEAQLRAKLDVTTNSIEEAKRISDEYKQEADEQREKVEKGNIEIAELRIEFEGSQKRFDDMEQANNALTQQVKDLSEQAIQSAKVNANLTAQLDASTKQLEERADIEKVLGDQFKVMANEAISNNNDAFLKTADEKIGTLLTQAKTDFSHSKDAVQELVKPLSEELKRIEEARNKSQGSLTNQIETLVQNNNSLTEETRNLANALKRPEVRGSWGEMQLRRVVELAGMSEYCDYEEQVSVTSDDGRRDRPDMIVRMPNERTIVIDSKTPMDAYLTAIESDTPEERESAIERHAQQVKSRAEDLAKKSYQDLFHRSPDFVVMFMPGEFLLQPALEKDRGLLDWAMQRNVVIATPNTLMALLKSVAIGWREAQIEEEAAKVAQLGQELHDRIRIFAGHMVKMRNSLNSTVENFNSGVGSLESRVLISARRFKDMGISTSQEIPELSEVNTQTREFRSAALRSLPEPEVVGDD